MSSFPDEAILNFIASTCIELIHASLVIVDMCVYKENILRTWSV
jgi:hypothetical protein